MSHTTHHDDCGCLTARYEARIATLEAALAAAEAKLADSYRERIGTVVDANGVALTVNRDMALTEIVLEAMTPAGPVALVFVASRGRNADVMRMLMGQPPRGLTVL